ncbi:Fanconi anemia group D2 protein [Cyanidiococcus yangmingshanensis]|uniref:Fanconi anemia group D2 protein n=1 Tax=Cyanidiococcus yangmingshanensis TaxID=2690220 RepID=A0A7J7IIQ4_9RHOD|nr:Fanconi anemia group D2 protein [Cyanidiococcus yangmingshanensis]
MYRSIGLMHRVVPKSDAEQDIGGVQSMDPFVPLVVRKLLTHMDVLSQRCGCVAAAIFISIWSEDNADHLRAVELLELSLQCTERRALVAAQLYAELGVAMTTDELAGADDTERHIARSMPARWLLSHALQRLTAQFICMFVGETESQERASSNKPHYAVRSEGAPNIMIPLASIVQSGGEDAQSLASLVPLFHLVWTLGLAQHGYESEWFRNELWPLLGAAVELPRALCSKTAGSWGNDRFRDQRLCLAAALNWLRAQVHCLAVLVQQGSELARTYLKQRLEHLTELDAGVASETFAVPQRQALSPTAAIRFRIVFQPRSPHGCSLRRSQVPVQMPSCGRCANSAATTPL